MSDSKQILTTINTELTKDSPDWNSILKITLAHFSCSTGTLHFLDDNSLLQLQSQVGIPEFLQLANR